ncbi:Nif3-like dinuclear metal center hexameric protein [Halobacillus campisalis]|uniref:GTP cyclohydrolase 1 type 2 homolog n=1 Tax=Halobacillus campisalis TaxID=435909 RepID=A0ABW2K401_9BACI|nr:Nif3-like dinuclear metal center hexameric protein [Halobacillus campisalis]
MANNVTASDIIKSLEEIAPKEYAFDWDNVGLQVGSLKQPVKKVMITLDVLENVVDEAIEQGADMIVAHHPLLFIKLNEINLDTPKGRAIKKLIQHNITVYASHTNLDVAEGGVNDAMAELLGIENLKPLIESNNEELVKLTVFVPESHTDYVRDAISEAGAGHIGDYSHCTYQVSGEGTFKPLEGSNPLIGSQGDLEKVKEDRLETILPKEKVDTVIHSMRKAHPYEEAAYDVFPLLNEGQKRGVGRIGDLSSEMTLHTLCELVKEKYQVPKLRFIGEPDQKVRRVALLGGSGEKYHGAALAKGADVYITGDMTFHLAQEAWENGLMVIDPGHHVEKVVNPVLKKYFDDKFSNEVKFFISASNTEPFRFC